MAKGQIGASMGGSIEYRYQLKPTTKNCRNCTKFKDYGEWRNGWCNEFRITITDATNAKLCKGFTNKHEQKSTEKKSKKPKKNTEPKRG